MFRFIAQSTSSTSPMLTLYLSPATNRTDGHSHVDHTLLLWIHDPYSSWRPAISFTYPNLYWHWINTWSCHSAASLASFKSHLDCTVLCRLQYIAQFTTKQLLWFVCDLERYRNMNCIILYQLPDRQPMVVCRCTNLWCHQSIFFHDADYTGSFPASLSFILRMCPNSIHFLCFIRFHTTPQPLYGHFSGTTRVSRCQKRTSGPYGARED